MYKIDFDLQKELEDVRNYINSCAKVNTKEAMAAYFTPFKYRYMGAAFNNIVQELIDEAFASGDYFQKEKDRIEYLLDGLCQFITGGKKLGVFSQYDKKLRNQLASITNKKQVFDLFYILEEYTTKLYKLSESVDAELQYKTRKLIYRMIMDFHFLIMEILEPAEAGKLVYSKVV